MKPILNTLYITNEKSFLSLENENIVISTEEGKRKIPLSILQSIVSFSYSGVTVPLMMAVRSKGIALMFIAPHSDDFLEVENGLHGNVLLRKEQYRQSSDEQFSKKTAAEMITAKILNQASVIRRYSNNEKDKRIKNSLINITNELLDIADNLSSLDLSIIDKAYIRGLEGAAARKYFIALGKCIKIKEFKEEYSGRIKRPPTDKFNATLSLLYTILAQDCRNALYAAGLDPFLGYLHVERPGRPSLALDLMEEYRPVIDRFTLRMINKKQLSDKDFTYYDGGAVFLNSDGKKKLFTEWQSFKKTEVHHPIIHEDIEWQMVPFIQAKLLAQTIRGDYDQYIPFLLGTTR